MRFEQKWQGIRLTDGFRFDATVPGSIQLDYANAQGWGDVSWGENFRSYKGIEDDAAREARRQELLNEYTEAFYNPYSAAASDQVTEVINPKETRAKIALALRTLLNKKETRPAKKHGNMPL